MSGATGFVPVACTRPSPIAIRPAAAPSTAISAQARWHVADEVLAELSSRDGGERAADALRGLALAPSA